MNPTPRKGLVGRAGIRGKLFLLSLFLLAISGVGGYAVLRGVVERSLVQRTEEELHLRLRLCEKEVLSANFPLEPSEAWDALADDLGQRSGSRVTLFDASQRILGDSHLDIAQIREGRPDDRPEVRRALAHERGRSARFSAVLNEQVIYEAAPIERAGEVVGAIRIAMPNTSMQQALSALHRGLFVACFVGVLVALLMSSFAAHLALQGVRGLTLAARRMAGGDLEVRARAEGQDEFADLGRSLEHLADELRVTMGQLVHERDLLSGILTGMREGVLLVDRRGEIALLNPALREMLFLSADDVGKPPREAITDAAVLALLEKAQSSAEAVQGEIEVGGIKPRNLKVRAERSTIEPGGLLVVFNDVTDLRRLETLRRDFVANASHELRTPVTSIRSAAETLAQVPPGDSAFAKFLAIIERNAERLQRLVSDLLDLSKIESRQYSLNREAVDVRVVAERAIALLAERAAQTQTKLSVDMAVGLGLASCDTRALEQILENLLENAIRYCPSATVRVTASSNDDHVALRVADTGPGIEASHLERLFERFYRVDTGRSRHLGGTGLGLAIVKHLAEAMGGSVSVESRVGKGTTFTVTLPTFQESADIPSSTPPSVQAA